MQQLVCPHCKNVVPQANINAETGLAKCDQCGAVQQKDDLTFDSTETPDQELPEPPPGARAQVMKSNQERLQLFLPKAKFGCSGSFGTVFLAFWVALVLLIGYVEGIFANWQAGLAVVGMASLGGFFLLRHVNEFKREEYVDIGHQQITITKKLPLVGHSSQTYNLHDIQGVEFERLHDRYRHQSHRINVILGSKSVEFFQNEEGVGKRWLADYLDQLVKKAR